MSKLRNGKGGRERERGRDSEGRSKRIEIGYSVSVAGS